jgi:hypothetical protein
MIGKVTFMAAMLISGLAFAQQPGASQPTPNVNAPNANSTQCWDTTTNQARNKMAQSGTNQPSPTVGAGNAKPDGATPAPKAGANAGAGSAANRPAGMANC